MSDPANGPNHPQFDRSRQEAKPIGDERPDDLVTLEITITRSMLCTIYDHMTNDDGKSFDTFEEAVEGLIDRCFTEWSGMWAV